MESSEESILGKIAGVVGFGRKKDITMCQLDIKSQEDDIESEALVSHSRKRIV